MGCLCICVRVGAENCFRPMRSVKYLLFIPAGPGRDLLPVSRIQKVEVLIRSCIAARPKDEGGVPRWGTRSSY